MWSKNPTENNPVYFAGGDLVGCLSQSIFSSHRVHRAARPPLGVPVVKLFCQYVYAGLTFRPTLDTPRFCSRTQRAPVLRRLPVHDSMQSIPPLVATDPLTIPIVRKVWAASMGWSEGYVSRDTGGGEIIHSWCDAFLTEADVRIGHTSGCCPGLWQTCSVASFLWLG